MNNKQLMEFRTALQTSFARLHSVQLSERIKRGIKAKRERALIVKKSKV